MSVSKDDTDSTWIDPDDAPELDDEWFAKATLMLGDTIIRPGKGKSGRPPGSTKELVTLRLDIAALDHFRAGGPGWQTRINEAVRKAAGL